MQKEWSFQEAKNIFELPFLDIIHRAQCVLRENFKPNEIQISTLLNIKKGGCSENCAYCAQSAHNQTGMKREPMMSVSDVSMAVKMVVEMGGDKLCMGAVGRCPSNSDLDVVCDMIKEVKSHGIQACVTLGMLTKEQALRLKDAGLDFYNHNIDTSKEFYPKIITTRKFEDRLETIRVVREAGINVCSGGIIGMGETNDDRINMLVTLANLENPPQSIPINKLIRMPGTPLENQESVDPFDFVKTIALARILFPRSHVRIAAGRSEMGDEMQALCFLAGANSIFYGENLLTAKNQRPQKDIEMMKRLGLKMGSGEI